MISPEEMEKRFLEVFVKIITPEIASKADNETLESVKHAARYIFQQGVILGVMSVKNVIEEQIKKGKTDATQISGKE